MPGAFAAMESILPNGIKSGSFNGRLMLDSRRTTMYFSWLSKAIRTPFCLRLCTRFLFLPLTQAHVSANQSRD